MNHVTPQPRLSRWFAPDTLAIQSVAVLAVLATVISALHLDLTPDAFTLLVGLCGLHLVAVTLVPVRRLPPWAQVFYLLTQALLASVVQVFAPAAPLAYVYLAIVIQAIVLLPLWLWVPFALLNYMVWSGLMLLATANLAAWLQDHLALAFPATCAIIAAIVYARQQRRNEQVQQMLQQMQQRYDQLAAGLRELQQHAMIEERHRLAQTIIGEVQQALTRTEQSLSAALSSAQSNLHRLQSTVAQARLTAAQTVERLRGALDTLRRGELPTIPSLSLLLRLDDEEVMAARLQFVQMWVLPTTFILFALGLNLIQHGLVPLALIGHLLLLLLAYVATQATRHPLLLQAGLLGQALLILTMSMLVQMLSLLLGLLLVLWQLLMRLPLALVLPYLIGISAALVTLANRLSPAGLSIEAFMVGVVSSMAVGLPLLLARYQFERRKQAELRLALLAAEIEQQSAEVQILAVSAERTRLAREVHDDLGSRLMLVSLQLQLAEELAAEDATAALEQLESSREQLQAAWRGVLAVADAELPLGDAGLVVALNALVAPLGGLVHLQCTGALEGLASSVASAAYRTVQEGVTNARRHAQPNLISVQVAAVPGYVTITVTNDSCVTAEAVGECSKQRSSFGLLGLRERAEALGGSIEVGPTDEQGWRLHVVIPVEDV
ncbi:sensor histidine kinase [Candidatus Viridilinea mediisalina]|uniref:histidine kinase n=1 Tax=Candidatus Viridilinea mediisalina TaxID=2024553 RepID=A0A2A6RHL9_9CHLR|nr:histidine kinase [Candidatus Viridilinea mediisalina]PDW02624.1 hypothetical protein CJ255_12945 [Candidatus Viridilinea mediisalina]